MSDEKLPSWAFREATPAERVPGPTQHDIDAWDALPESEKQEIWARTGRMDGALA